MSTISQSIAEQLDLEAKRDEERQPPKLDPDVAASRAVGKRRREHNKKFRKHSDSRETIE